MAVHSQVDQDEAPASALLLTVPEAAALLKITAALCYELVAGRQIPSLRLSARTIRIPRQALEAWVVTAAQPAEEL